MPVFINNADDYLGPSQACVNPLFTAPAPANTMKSQVPSIEDLRKDATINSSEKTELSASLVSVKVAPRHRKQQRRVPRITYEDKSAQSNNRNNSVRLESSANNSSDEHKSADVIDSTTYTISTKKKATVTLSDCLACSGCVTSAEAVLMSHHSIDKLKELCTQQIQSEKKKKIVFTISPASLSDLYRHLYIEEHESGTSSVLPSRQWLFAKVATFLHNEFGAEMVIDGTLPQTISLLESATEFCYRYRRKMSRNESIDNQVPMSQELPSIALSSTQTRFINKHSGTLSIGDEDTLTEVTTVNHSPGLIIEEDNKEEALSATLKASSLPVLSSSCPGFVCLVEKTVSTAVPFLSSAKSPMAVAGTMVKSGMCSKQIEATKDLFHVAIMPCHDKKLEAGRGDFSWEQQTLLSYSKSFQNDRAINKSNYGNIVTEELVKEVDMVLTTGELLEVLTETVSNKTSNAINAPSVHSIRCTLDELKEAAAEDLVLLESEAGHLADGENEQIFELYGSGSYADYIFRYAALDLFNCRLPLDEPLPWADSSQTNDATSNTGNSVSVIRRRRKRPDMSGLREVSLYKLADGTYSCIKPKDAALVEPVLKFATAYGFKNVQTVLHSLQKTTTLDKRIDCHYIEIMACPSGCPNGGGQIGANGRRETPRETKERVRKVVQTLPRVRPQYGRLPLYYGRNEPFSQEARRIFHTRNHVVPELELSTGAIAGVAVNDTKW